MEVFLRLILVGLFLPVIQAVPLNEAVKDPCSTASFDQTLANWDSVDAGTYYHKWLSKAVTETAFSSLGEANYFAHSHGFRDVNCGISFKGCKNLPSCDAVISKIADLELARRVYLTLQQFDNLNVLGSAIYEATGHAQVDTTGLFSAAAMTFFWRPDPKNIKACAIYNEVVNTVVSVTTGWMMAMLPEIAPAIGGAVAALSPALNGVADIAQSVWEIKDNGVGKHIWGMMQGAASGYTIPRVVMAVDQGCLAAFPVAPDLKFEKSSELALIARKTFMVYREDLSNFMKVINNGTGLDGGEIKDGKSYLATLVASGRFLATNAPKKMELVNNPGLIEKQLVSRATRIIVTQSLIDSRCFVVCEKMLDSTSCNPEADHKLAKMRFCSSDGQTSCQSQCWQPRKKAKNVSLYGADEMGDEPWNIDLPEYLQDSYKHYKEHGFTPADGLPDADGLFGADSGDGSVSSVLPVCVSTLALIGDYSKHGSKNDRLLPCSCGDWTSSETAQFLNAIGMSTATHRKELTQRCPKQLNKQMRRPLDHFLALCELDVHWPRKKEARKVYPGADPRCGEVRELVKSLVAAGKSPDEANTEFCGSTVGKLIRLDQHDWLAVPHIYGTDRKCKRFLKEQD